MKITATQPYGGVIPGNEYTLVSEGSDHKVIKVKGSVLTVPNWAFAGKIPRKYVEEEEDDYLMMGLE